jgi:SAM-dependent methyltransferase
MKNNTEVKIGSCIACGSGRANFFAAKNGFEIFRCPSCRLLFVYPAPQDTSYVYGSDYFSGAEKGFGYVNYGDDKEAMRGTFLAYLEKIEQLAGGVKGSLLDIGAANGYFLSLAKARGWNVRGVDVSDYAANQARQKGFDVLVGDIKKSLFHPDTFDVVTMWDVIEHLADPEEEIEAILRLLKPGGFLAINTPDGNSWFARILKQRWHQLIPPEHLLFFNPLSLRLFLERYGFNLRYKSKIGKKFTLQYVFQVAAKWQNFILWRWAFEFFRKSRVGNLAVPINLYDNFFTIFQKGE